jgi:Putative peptidoglycan binding domain
VEGPQPNALARELQERLARTGDYTAASSGVFDAATRAALVAYMGRENLEERAADGDVIDAEVLRYMRSRSP